MKTLWFVSLLAVAFMVVSCDGSKKVAKDTEALGDTDTMTDGESNGDGSPDADIRQANQTGEQSWFGTLPTGQKKCYDDEKEISCPLPGEPFFGQDSQFNEWKTRSFVPSGGTVADSVTHLLWQLSYQRTMTWQQAYSYCDSLYIAAAPTKRWRLPAPHELKSLISYGLIRDNALVHPATSFPCNCSFDATGNCTLLPAGCTVDTPSDWFWASTQAQNANMAWIVFFYDGFMDYTEKSNKYSVRCVTTE